MGRLFRKFFLAIFLAQLVTVSVLGVLFWVHDPRRGGHPPPPPPPEWTAAAPGSAQGMPPPRPPPPPHDSPYPLLPLGVGLFASLAFAVLLARHFSRPIMALRSAFESVARGDFDVSLAAQMHGRSDELADLTRDFDRTALRLKSLMDSQRRLLHDVSHEVRSPLARMQLAIDLARQQPEKTAASIERIERESVRIDRLMEELLTLARLEAHAHGALEESVDVAGLVCEIVDDARFEGQAKGCRVELTQCGEAQIKGRTDLLHRAIENVIRNALHHTFDATAVKVAVAVQDRMLRISVDDDGPGVPDTVLGAMFEPFMRFREGRSDGYGLGLAITRGVIEAHGGRLRAENRGSGGLRVVMELPCPEA